MCPQRNTGKRYAHYIRAFEQTRLCLPASLICLPPGPGASTFRGHEEDGPFAHQASHAIAGQVQTAASRNSAMPRKIDCPSIALIANAKVTRTYSSHNCGQSRLSLRTK